MNGRQHLLSLKLKTIAIETIKLLFKDSKSISVYGRPVVEACIETNTHYVDISSESYFNETIQLDFYDLAKEKGDARLAIRVCFCSVLNRNYLSLTKRLSILNQFLHLF